MSEAGAILTGIQFAKLRALVTEEQFEELREQAFRIADERMYSLCGIARCQTELILSGVETKDVVYFIEVGNRQKLLGENFIKIIVLLKSLDCDVEVRDET